MRLAGNPLRCDCELEWILDSEDDDAATALVSDLPVLECSVPSRVGEDKSPSAAVPVLSVPRGDFLCRYQAHCSPSCMCCDFYACDCRFQCPDGCACFRDRAWSENAVRCSGMGHAAVPLLLPLDATDIRLDGNSLGHIDTQSFLGRGNVRELYLNGSGIISMGNNTFSGLANLEVLHLEDNNIAELRGHEFSALGSLRELYLHDNDLVYVNEITFEPLRQLRTLTLDGNLLTVFPVWHLLNNPSLSSVTLARNTWSCECEFIEPFNYFLERRADAVADYDRIQCVSDNAISAGGAGVGGGGAVLCRGASGASGGNRRSASLAVKRGAATSPSVLAPADGGADGDAGGVGLVPVLVPLIVVAVVFVAGFLAVFVFRRDIKEWLYSKGSSVTYDRGGGGSGGATASGNNNNMAGSSSSASSSSTTYAGRPDGTLFDVYVSYSIRDADFVDQTLAPTLEHAGPASSYKLCLHQRDFPPNATLQDTVAVAAESSSRVLVVLSRAYIEAEWPLVKAPLRAAVGGGEGGRMVLLLTEDLPDDGELARVDPELPLYLRTCPVVRWGSHGFLNKLRFFLPESAFLTFQRSVTLRQLQQQQQQQPPLPPPQLQQLQQLRSQQQGPAPHLPPPAVYAARSEHTYHSIPDDSHIYHTLEPRALLKPQQQQQQQQMLHLRHQQQLQQLQLHHQMSALSSPSASPADSFNQHHHSHTHSTSSGANLLPATTMTTAAAAAAAATATAAMTTMRKLEEYVV